MTTQRSPSIGVAGIVVRPDHRVLMIQRAGQTMKGLWAFPGGRLEWGESLREAVQRELREETGLAVVAGALLYVAEVRTADAHFVILDFAAESKGFEVIVGSDARAARWVNEEEATALPLAEGMAECLRASPVRDWLGWAT
ncbi:MAG: NUDIX domain-containing protein [Firmicutes bacterium]|nr:NUDIX domain-containing protein [Bacillota bacterium]